jgi:hypothetical protein
MNRSVGRILITSFMLGIGGMTGANTSDAVRAANYVMAIERYESETKASYDSVDRREVTSGTDRGAQLYVYLQKGNVQRVVFDYGLSRTNTLYSLLYKDGELVKATESEVIYHSAKDGEISFCQPYPEVETNRIYFRGSEVICLSSSDKTCTAIRSDAKKQEAIRKGASDLIRRLLTSQPGSEVPDFDFLKYL